MHRKLRESQRLRCFLQRVVSKGYARYGKPLCASPFQQCLLSCMRRLTEKRPDLFRPTRQLCLGASFPGRVCQGDGQHVRLPAEAPQRRSPSAVQRQTVLGAQCVKQFEVVVFKSTVTFSRRHGLFSGLGKCPACSRVCALSHTGSHDEEDRTTAPGRVSRQLQWQGAVLSDQCVAASR